MKIVDLKQDTQEWLNYRKEKFNASEVGDLFGVGFNSPLKLAHIKYGDLKIYENDAMKKGKEKEAEIREKFNALSGKNFQPLVCVSETDDRFSASLDGYNAETNEILEIKLSLSEYENLSKGKMPSQKYYLQVQHQLLVSGAVCAWFVVSEPFGDIKFKKIEPDLELWQEIIKKWNEFENEFKGKELPPLENEINENTPNADMILSWVTQCEKLRAKKAEIETQIAEIETSLKELSGGVKTRIFNKCLVYSVKRKSVDYKSILKDNGLKVTPIYEKTSESLAIKWL